MLRRPLSSVADIAIRRARGVAVASLRPVDGDLPVLLILVARALTLGVRMP